MVALTRASELRSHDTLLVRLPQIYQLTYHDPELVGFI